MTNNGRRRRDRDASKLGVSLVDEDVSLDARRGQRGHDQHKCAALVVPLVAEPLAGALVVSVPAGQIRGSYDLNAGA